MTTPLSGPMLPPREAPADSLVILLHGYGSDGADLIGLGQYWRGLLPHTLFVAPNAPSPCAINPAGYEWFPLDLEGDRALTRLVGADDARPVIAAFLEAVWAQTGIGPERTVLAGFSQGAMMALDVGLRQSPKLAGIVGFSGMLIAPERLAPEAGEKVKVALFHGAADEVVPVAGSREAERFLVENGYEVALHVTPGSPHTIPQDALELAGMFIARQLGAAG